MTLVQKISPPLMGCKTYCDFCTADAETVEIRVYHGPYGRPGEPWYVAPSYCCEDCFMPQDDGPCFDDLPHVVDVDNANIDEECGR